MWEGINAAQTTKCNLTWLVEGMKSNALVWVTDGLYDQKCVADLSGVGWIIFCSKTGLRLTGTFWEQSPAASSYWVEMLGLCALHLFARALSEFHKIQEWKEMLCCDNKRALKLSSYAHCITWPSAICTDIQQSLKATKRTFTGKFTYVHVFKHMDRYLLWHQLSLPQQLNCICNMLAKHAVTSAMMEGSYNRPTQLLPKEDVEVVIWGNNITNDISHTIRFQASKEAARKYWGNKKKKPWPNACFDKVDWEHLDLALKNKPDTYKIWRSKQNSSFCGTRGQVGMYLGTTLPDKRCPNCSRRETADHLLLCSNEDRTQLLIENTDELERWLERDGITDPELSYWIPKYILMLGNKPFAELGAMSSCMKALAVSRYIIGYCNFMEGYISTHFYAIQSFHLAMSSSYLNGANWAKQFISKFLHVTHFQWIFRNISLHNKINKYLHKKKSEEIMLELESLAGIAPEDVPTKSQFLLHINFSKLS